MIEQIIIPIVLAKTFAILRQPNEALSFWDRYWNEDKWGFFINKLMTCAKCHAFWISVTMCKQWYEPFLCFVITYFFYDRLEK